MLFLVTLIYLFTKKKKLLLKAVNNYFQLQKKNTDFKESLTLLNKK